LIRAYQKWKGTDYVPPLTHPSLKWSVKDPLPFLPVVTNAPWQIIDKKKMKEVETVTAVEVKTTDIQPGFVAANSSVPVKSGEKRKLEEAENLSASTKKTKATQMIMTSNDSSSPSGLIWDSYNYSCAYDSIFTVLYEIWSNDTKVWTRRFKKINQRHLKSLSICFKKIYEWSSHL
jgi:hypothetical protein